MYEVGLIDYMMKILLGMYEVVYTCLVVYEVHVKACGLLKVYLVCVRLRDFTCTLH